MKFRNKITGEIREVSRHLINSALVSAQNRQRYYWTNIPNVPQPEDRGILLRDILESGTDLSQNEKSYCLTASYDGAVSWNTLERGQRSMVAEPVRLGTIESEAQNADHDSKQYRVYSPDGKATTLCGQGGGVGAKTGLYACPVEAPACLRYERTEEAKKLRKAYEAGEITHGFHEHHELHPREDGKSNTISTVQKDNLVIEDAQKLTTRIQNKLSHTDRTVYEVRDGKITIKGKQYPIKLLDGFYIIRKLTVTECCRLQTMPDDYCRAVSATQGYKGLGNGWTAEVIIHILKHMNIPLDEEIVVLSMYDGIGTGRYCFDKMGYTNVTYHAYEIDKYAMQIAMSNYPDIIQHGDAFQVRDEGWIMIKNSPCPSCTTKYHSCNLCITFRMWKEANGIEPLERKEDKRQNIAIVNRSCP